MKQLQCRMLKPVIDEAVEELARLVVTEEASKAYEGLPRIPQEPAWTPGLDPRAS